MIYKNEDQRISVKFWAVNGGILGKDAWPVHLPLLRRLLGRLDSGLPQLCLLQSISAGELASSLVIFQRLWIPCGKLLLPQEIPYEKDSNVSLVTLSLLPFQQTAPSSFIMLKGAEKPKPSTLISFLFSLESFLLFCPWKTFWTCLSATLLMDYEFHIFLPST